MRDDFPQRVKEELAKRVGYKCSNPVCRQPTSGPQLQGAGAVNVGVAAHIAGASPGGPRYDPSMTEEERKSVQNGIWLCQNHGKLVDSDLSEHTKELLLEWKETAEAAAYLEVRELTVVTSGEATLHKIEKLMAGTVLGDEGGSAGQLSFEGVYSYAKWMHILARFEQSRFSILF